ncbi:MAG: tetratricopeptide repeat protein, partial [Bacteroidia bacterium]|nr:tetratricopeptide repeat protein [Bacteroidia bacterium]
MKICLNILIAVLCNWTCFSQNFSPNDQAKIDSLKAVIVEQGSNDTVVINSLLELAIYYYSTNPDTTITMCTQAGELSEKNNYVTGKSDSYSWLGYLFEKKGNLSKALGYQKRSLKINKETQDKLGIAHNLNNIGLIYQRRGDVATALDYFQRSLKIRTDIMDKPGIATSLNNIGFVYQIHGDVSNALAYYLRSLKIDEEIGNKKGIAGSLNNIGLIYKTQGD